MELSNTYFFEKTLGWKGICIEPQNSYYSKLIENRTCDCINACIADFSGKGLFMEIDGYSKMLSGLVNKYDNRHLRRIYDEVAAHGGNIKRLEVDCIILNDLLESKKIQKIDYCSIDIEGGEMDILKSIDFNKFDFDVFSIENNYKNLKLERFMLEKGFKLFSTIHCDEIYKKI